MKLYILLSCVVLHAKGLVPPVYSTELETELRQSLLHGYDPMQRPSKTTTILTTLNMLSLNYLDIKEQTLSVTAYFNFRWIDERLIWRPNTNYSNIVFIFSNELSLWKPSIIVENSVVNLDVLSKPQVLMRIRSDGTVVWTPGGVYSTHCTMDVTYYPLDIQTCEIIISTWAYTANEIALVLNDHRESIVMDFYNEHGEWVITETTYSKHTTFREAESFSRIKFTLKFRRRPLFHMLNTLFPVVLMGFLTVVIFKLSPESGERVGLSLTILLAFAVYLTLISEDIPQTSISASILSAYLATILLLQTIAVFLTVIYLDIYFKDDNEPIPAWLHIMMARLHRRNPSSQVKPITPPLQPPTNNGRQEITITNLDVDKTSGASKNNQPNRFKMNEFSNKPKGAKIDKNDVEGSISDVDGDEEAFTWKQVSRTLDRITMYLYLFLVTSLTLISMAIILSSYLSN